METRDRMNADDVMNSVEDNIATAKQNIGRGFKMLLFALGRLFLETWIVQEIWNRVVTDIVTETSTATYWQAFFLMLMIRIVTGQFKISMSAKRDKKVNKDNVKK